MTRQEFIDNVTTWSELLDFCYDENIDFCEDVYTEDAKDEYFDDILVDMARDAGCWQELYNRLEEIPTGYDYYIRDDYGDFEGADDDDFDSHYEDVLEYMDDNEYWDDDDGDEDYEEEPVREEYVDPEDEEPVEEEDVSIAELFTTCNSKLQKIDADTEAAARAAEEEDEEAFNDFCAEVGVTVTVEIKGGNA